MPLWEENIRKVVPYTPGEQPKEANIIKLNTNENPYPPSPAVQAAVAGIPDAALRKYPDPAAAELVNALAARYGRKPSEVFVGVGSDDVLAMCFLTFFNNREKPVLFPDITYSFYDVWADLFRIPYETVPLDDAFRIRPEQYERENGGIVFPNPNAPTGRAMALADAERIIASSPGSVVIVDEAYVDFGAESAAGLIPKYDNLLVVQTFSKSRSLAGERIGFAFGNESLIRYLNDCKYSFNSYTMNRTAIAAGTAALKDEKWFREKVGKVIATRGRAEKEFAALGFRFYPSVSNFLFVTHPAKPAAEIFKELRERHIYVRYFAKPRIDNYLRITIGTDEEMDALFAALREILA
ncbi:MAG: histidinol-phosphate transaminase [Lachnospiraceae bacterium]|nr:histidinol-phosphate transaminase [Lachnospiraceae bacterium]